MVKLIIIVNHPDIIGIVKTINKGAVFHNKKESSSKDQLQCLVDKYKFIFISKENSFELEREKIAEKSFEIVKLKKKRNIIFCQRRSSKYRATNI